MIEDVASAAGTSRPTPDPFPLDGLGAVLRRSIIACDRERSIDDQIDCAGMALDLGYVDAARLLYEGAFLRRGFSEMQIVAQARIAARTGLWPDEAWPGDPPRNHEADFAVDLALGELRRLIELAPEASLPPLPAVDVTALAAGRAWSIGAVSPDRARRTIDAGLMTDLCGRLCSSLRASDGGQLDQVLEEVRDHLLVRPRWEPRDYADVSITDLAAGVVAGQLQAFFGRNYNLCWAPFGSSDLFAAAARLPNGGLGPYFGNVRQLLRSERDLMGLTLLAGADDGSGRSPRFQRWLVLLSTHLGGGDRVGLADEFADRGFVVALQGMFGAAGHAAVDRHSRLPWIIRDAALDLGQLDLAAQAQASIVSLSPERVEEWIVLAEVLGGSDGSGAEQALAEALRLDPEESALELNAALMADDFRGFEVLSGLGSPPWRVAVRAPYRSQRDRPNHETSRAEAVLESVEGGG